jgi:hypothetical protein
MYAGRVTFLHVRYVFLYPENQPPYNVLRRGVLSNDAVDLRVRVLGPWVEVKIVLLSDHCPLCQFCRPCHTRIMRISVSVTR